MSKVDVTIDIDAPPEAVFDAMLDPDRLAEWVTIHRAVNDARRRARCARATAWSRRSPCAARRSRSAGR